MFFWLIIYCFSIFRTLQLSGDHNNTLCLKFRRGDFGRLGHGNYSDLFTPQPIKALNGLRIRQIACGDSHCLAVTMEGEVQRSVMLLTYFIFLNISNTKVALAFCTTDMSIV